LNRLTSVAACLISLHLLLTLGSVSFSQVNLPVKPGTLAKTARVDREGVPLPPGAIARFGSTRLRHGGMTDFTFLPDGNTLLTVGTDGFLRYWDLKTGLQKRAKSFGDRVGLLRDVTLAANGKIAALEEDIFSTSNESRTGKARLSFRDVESGRLLRESETAANWLIYRDLSPDGSHFYGVTWVGKPGSQRARSFIQECLTGTEIDVSSPASTNNMVTIFGAGFAPNGKWCAVAGNERHSTKIIDIATGKPVCVLGKWKIGALDFSPDSKLLIVSTAGGNEPNEGPCLRLITLPSGEPSQTISTSGPFDDLVVSHSGKVIAALQSGQISLIDLPSGLLRRRFADSDMKMLFSQDDRTLAVANQGNLHFWDIETGKKLESTAFIGSAFAFSADGRLLASWHGVDHSLSIWNLEKEQAVTHCKLDNTRNEAQSISRLTFSPDGRILYAMNQQQPHLFAWETAFGNPIGRINLARPQGEQAGGWGPPLVSPDGHLALAIDTTERNKQSDGFNRLAVWDLPDGKLAYAHPLQTNWRLPRWLPRGKALFDVSGDGCVTVDLASGLIRGRLKPSPQALGLLPSSDGRLLAVKRSLLDQNSEQKIYESFTGKEAAALGAGPSDNLTDPVWLDDRTLLIFKEHEMQIWDIPTQKIRHRIPLEWESGGSKDGIIVTLAHLLPDGRRLFTSLLDGTALLWDLGPALPEHRKEAEMISKTDVNRLWNDLASANASEAYRAIWRLIDAPSVMPSLIDHLKEPADPEYKKARNLIALLDDNSFKVRENAQKQLENQGISALQAIRDAQGQKNSPEVNHRLERLASRFPPTELPAHTLRRLRAIQILEKVGSPEARKFLTDLAANTTSGIEKEEALAALEYTKAAKIGATPRQ
jgi:WD40 repeat protein